MKRQRRRPPTSKTRYVGVWCTMVRQPIDLPLGRSACSGPRSLNIHSSKRHAHRPRSLCLTVPFVLFFNRAPDHQASNNHAFSCARFASRGASTIVGRKCSRLARCASLGDRSKRRTTSTRGRLTACARDWSRFGQWWKLGWWSRLGARKWPAHSLLEDRC